MTDRAVPLSSLGLTARAGANPMITGIAVDSREVREGTLFAAMPGSRVHGAEFIQYALRMGAAAVLTDAAGAKLAAEELAGSDAALVVSDSPREALARTAALWFGGQPATMIAVTGTNGKTSVSTFVRQIWVEMGLPAVNLGTTGVEGAWAAPLAHTTPEPITLHRTLAEAAQNGITHAAMEASSHGLDQRRLDGVTLKAAGFTNFTQDHLDYHETFEAYFAAKAALFARVLPEDGTAVVNIDDEKGVDIAAIARARGCEVITVGRDGGDLHLQGQRFDATGQDLRFSWRGKTYQKRLNLIGGFQGDNVLLAAGLVIACGADPQEVFDTLPHLTTVRGRMQLAATRDNGAAVFVDYAHTPDAVATALAAMRPHVMGRLVAIVGAGGDRDRAKRPLMGQAAAENADMVIVTDDNPRSEDPASIRAAVLDGAPDAMEVGDRAEAILRGVDALEPGDALLIAGKGHETGQTVGDDVLPFDDVEQASVAVAALDGRLA
ncbi:MULTISPECIES: UDP-N-acetylmuramoyl-L-alanyl-D-glutamate--2,6-diaminopimelate ligase [unclassified Sulfitobacter]|jgi:UDP-N-acetylmuramoyl-L-alanyl-D-glutamate--2,6-diaminopimelate ligase|uniref:UDP-N-acetylmuramoyl-L-alanyl-D-glutamate--2, 6-diaminopimelate ligase n=1 Tax=unclassified Sulfitobacter TaxID=196795 RepID=UPI0007C3367B|nr:MULTISPECIES: UDP-N-acetylmuramoyl-L-alanyl-D-glutamate--2,6-diaminopimelate ligase [unclassified Sulfitobacter]KZX96845.1 UDP-N-acetylmuramoyl-L-alanyl-D-glutamate--2,6-diaminopimelate ligase [Sulfitobacter sp. HI0021]KZY02852.1 UDP-N-acetylmuramoyl-L-alanyl-D-glutamate--2,6-diaminopimelate ligase [Sulfitobacter sp. HI0027]KZZ02927.1 UDP-N-acetylmuramoyl-L-alanyl-D-glutamate--2,6-diaminopimelate ligase [Sulfitobacter sp. HI0076]